MVVKGEEPATTRDMEPGIVVDQHSLDRRTVVAVQHTDHLQHVIPAELLQLLHTGFRPAKNLELALEDLTVALREWSGIGITRTLRGASQKQLAKFTVQGYRLSNFAKPKGTAKKGATSTKWADLLRWPVDPLTVDRRSVPALENETAAPPQSLQSC